MIRLSVILVTLISVLTACSGAKQPAPAATPSPAAQAPSTTPAASTPTTAPAAAPVTAPASTPTTAGSRGYELVSAQSKVSYIATEMLAGATIRNQAIGTTSSITGELVLNAEGKVQSSTFTVDLRTLTSDRSNRDNYIRTRGLESNRYPNATFTITEVNGSPSFKTGDKETFELVGKMKIRETERTVTWPVTSTVENGSLRWTATLDTKMTDWGIDPPVLLVRSVAEIDDPLKLQISLLFKPKS